jgi:hypothetical protein
MRSHSFRLLGACLAALSVTALLPGCFGISSSGFKWSLEPEKSTTAPGAQTTYDFTIISKDNINSKVSLRIEDLPANITATFTPQTLPNTADTSTLTVQTTAATPPGTYTFSVFVREEGQKEEKIERSLIVTQNQVGQPDFSLEVNPVEFTFGGSADNLFGFVVHPLNGFSGNVTITLTGLIAGLHLIHGLNPAVVSVGQGGAGAGGTFRLGLDPVPPATSPVDLVLTAARGNIVHTRTIRINIPQ